MIVPQRDASAGSKDSVNLLRINFVSLANSHTQRFAVTVSFRRKLLTLRQLSHGRNIYFYFAEASARTSSDTASTWCVCGTQKVWGTFWGLTTFLQQAYTLHVNGQKYHCISFVSWHIKYRSILLMVLKSLLSWRAIQICSTNEESTILDYSIVNVLS